MPLQIRRGTAAERNALSSPLVIGELIYVTDQGKLYIGDGTALGGSDALGNPGQGGKGLIITGFTSEEAQDAMAVAFSNGVHSNIFFTYDDTANSMSAGLDLSSYIGNVAIDGTLSVTGNLQAAAFKGSIFADDSTLLVDAVSGTIPYSVITGAPTTLSTFTNDVGYIRVADIADGTVTIDVNNTGDLQGSVYGDDSTLLVDAVNSSIPASVLTGTFTGNVIGDVTGELTGNVLGNITGDVTGNLTGNVTGDVLGNLTGNVLGDVTGNLTGSVTTNLITSVGSTTIFVDSPTNFNSTIQVSGISNFLNETIITTTSTSQRLLSATQIHDTASSGSGAVFRRARGTTSSLAVVVDGDNLGNILFAGHDGTAYRQSALIRGTADGTISSNRVPGKIEFLTISDFTGALTEKMFIGSRNDIVMNAELFVNSSFYDVSPMATFNQAHSTADARNFDFVRSRGTIESPTAVQNGDGIADIVFSAYDGVNLLPQVAAVLEVAVDGSVSPGSVPAGFYFSTFDGASLLNRVTISAAGLLTALNDIETPNIAPVATDGDLQLDPASKGTGTIDFKAPVQSTVGSAGGASALPAAPSTYLKVKINGSTYVIPAYAAS